MSAELIAERIKNPCRFQGPHLQGQHCSGHRVFGCSKHGECTFAPSLKRACVDCGDYAKPIRILFRNGMSPGDVVVQTMAVESLKLAYGSKYAVAVDTLFPEVWANNPWIVPGREDGLLVDCDNLDANQSLTTPVHYAKAYCDRLAERIGEPVPLKVNRPSIYLTEQERLTSPAIGGQYWILNAGTNYHTPTKGWGAENFQSLVHLLEGKVRFVQIGKAEDQHPPLEGVIDMRGKTNLRELILLCWHAAGGVGPTTFVQHVFAAFEKPYVCIVGGREPTHWLHYPKQTTLSTVGKLPCCESQACWRSTLETCGNLA